MILLPKESGSTLYFHALYVISWSFGFEDIVVRTDKGAWTSDNAHQHSSALSTHLFRPICRNMDSNHSNLS